MDLTLTEEERMVLEVAAGFAEDHLGPQARAHEKAGALPDTVQAAFARLGIGDLADTVGSADMPIRWAARVAMLSGLAAQDPAAALGLWLPRAARSLAGQLGAPQEVANIHLVHDLSHLCWPLPCMPLSGPLLIVDLRGRWQVAQINATPIRAIGLRAAGPARCALREITASGESEPVVAARARALLRLWGAAILVGSCRAALRHASSYVQERVAFGRPLSEHQGIAFLIADMVIQTETAELLAWKAGWALENDLEHASRTANDAWLEAIEAALWVTDHGVQLLGGHGYMQDHPVEKWMRDARGLSLLWGGADLARAEHFGAV